MVVAGIELPGIVVAYGLGCTAADDTGALLLLFCWFAGDWAAEAAAAAAFWAAACDFLRWAAGFDKWLAPVGFPLRTEHFWK